MLNSIDIFCDIIDNYGDIGVVYRLAKELRNHNKLVRIFVNQQFEVAKIIEGFNPNLDKQELNGITFINLNNMHDISGAEVIIEAFATDLPELYIKNCNSDSKIIINLEYLSAEPWTLDYHLKSSFSPKQSIEKYFYMPGFTKDSGGIILDKSYLEKVSLIKKDRISYFNNFFWNYNLIYDEDIFYINIFTYSWNFELFLDEYDKAGKKTVFFILDNKVLVPNKNYKNLTFVKIPYIKQEEFDILINLVDFNFVRGEESFIRAILAEIPFLWHIYLQDEEIHLEKLEAYLKLFEKYFENSETYNIYKKLSFEFNKNQNFSNQFIKILKIKKINAFSKQKLYLEEHCDLVEKLLNFIDSRINKYQEEIK